MKKNVLSRSFVLKIAVILWTISFGSSVLAADYISTLDLKFTNCGTTTSESVNATVDLGRTHTLTASGYISGTLQLNDIRQTRILTGTWAGWEWCHSTYTLGGYSGDFYQIRDNNTHKGWGHARGDIFAAGRKVGNMRTWYITSVNGQQVTGTIYLTLDSGTAPISTTDYFSTNLIIRSGARFDGTSSGYYTGPFMNTATGVFLTDPIFSPERGFAIPQYVTNIGSGTGYMFWADPALPAFLRYGTWDGPFFGIQTRGWNGGCSIGKDVWGTHQHVLGGSTSSSANRVPVFNGWWLLMGIFPGLFLILGRVRRS